MTSSGSYTHHFGSDLTGHNLVTWPHLDAWKNSFYRLALCLVKNGGLFHYVTISAEGENAYRRTIWYRDVSFLLYRDEVCLFVSFNNKHATGWVFWKQNLRESSVYRMLRSAVMFSTCRRDGKEAGFGRRS